MVIESTPPLYFQYRWVLWAGLPNFVSDNLNRLTTSVGRQHMLFAKEADNAIDHCVHFAKNLGATEPLTNLLLGLFPSDMKTPHLVDFSKWQKERIN